MSLKQLYTVFISVHFASQLVSDML